MDNFFFGNKSNNNYSRTYSKGTSFKFSVWNENDTYNNDEFVVDFVQWDKSLWAAKKTSTNIVPSEGDYWELIVKGVSDIEFRQIDNRIEYRYIDPTSEWKDLFELASVSEDQIKKMLEDLDVKYGNTYDSELSETSTNAVQNQAVTKKFKKLDEKNTKTDSELSNIKSSVTATLSNAKSYTDSEITKIDNKINSEISRAETNISGRINDLEEDLVNALNEAKEYTNSLADGEVKNNTNKINILNGTGEGSVKKTVKDEIAKVVDGAPEQFNTLKEISEYLNSHEDVASGLVESITKLETGKVSKADIDSTLSTTSENPVMNKVITEELNKKLEGEVVGATSPTEGTVGGSYDDTELRNAIADLQAKDTQTDEQLTELSQKTDALESEFIYSSPLDGVEFGARTADVYFKKVLKAIWIEILDDSVEFPEKWYLYVIRNASNKTPQFAVQVCHTSATDANIAFTFTSATKQTGTVEILCSGYGTYLGKANLHMVLDFSEALEDVNYSGATTINTTFNQRELNRVKVADNISVKAEIVNLGKELTATNEGLFNLTSFITGELKSQSVVSYQNRIGVYLVTPNVSQYRFRLSTENPTNNSFSVYKAKADHSDLERITNNANMGSWIVIDRDEEKPVLYIYDTNSEDKVIEAKTYIVDFQNTYSLAQDVENLKNKESNGSSWKGKTIVCFGDSLTEFKDYDNQKTYSDYIHDLTEANVINIGIGGTQFRKRNTPVDAPTSSSQAYAALDVASLVQANCEQDFTKQIAAAQYLTANESDNNESIVSRMQTIEWDKVDIVTIFAGTNDWNNGYGTWGEETSNDMKTTFGAINEIVRMLMNTYPHVVVYWFTPTVRWLTNEAGERTEETFSDNFKRNDTTLRDFSARIEAVIKRHHIPICDMYNTLGWNMYNFSQFFSDTDGVHPRKGKGTEQIARKMIAFINANKTF